MPKQTIGEELADAHDKSETLIFWFEDLLQDHHLHKVWDHLLDGQCLWDQLSDDVKIYKWNVLWCLATAVAAWLRHICRHVRQKSSRYLRLQGWEASKCVLWSDAAPRVLDFV